MPRYMVGARPGSGAVTDRSSAAISRPSASAVRSACLASTFTPAKSWSSAPVSAKLARAAARPVIRTTPGDSDAPSMPRVRSRGWKPVPQRAQR